MTLRLSVIGDDDVQVCNTKTFARSQAEKEANANRIVACGSACDGFTNEELEGFSDGKIIREASLYAEKSPNLKAAIFRENRYKKGS